MYIARSCLALFLLAAVAGCDATHERIYPTDDVSGRWIGTGAFESNQAYDADLVFRQAGRDVTVNGTIAHTDATGGVTASPYNLRATLQDHTLIFESGFGVATLSEDGRSLQWRYGSGSATYDLTRR